MVLQLVSPCWSFHRSSLCGNTPLLPETNSARRGKEQKNISKLQPSFNPLRDTEVGKHMVHIICMQMCYLQSLQSTCQETEKRERWMKKKYFRLYILGPSCTFTAVVQLAGSSHTSSMLLLQGLLLISLWSCGDAQAAPRQSLNVLRTMQGSSTTIRCQMDKEHVLHWYRQLPGQPPRRIAYFLRNTFFDDNQYKTKFQILKHPSQPNYRLVINHLTPQDSGTYFCAYWFYEGITALDRQR
ncbi:uncharacterized protein LOC135189328 isoform X2 [Pogoniulus pusillus]|uniref:uncharacterized protein LOC135189328 isoform X2 n=1 Tax=Pogoniulus pusillus TaxID=488313 RepID=UPI0030B93B5D